jgi:hypothetical protein
MILLGVGAVCLGLFLAFWFWHSPVRRKLTQPKIDRYLGAIERQVFLPQDDKPKALARLRAWAEADDGRPFYMFNLMFHGGRSPSWLARMGRLCSRRNR